jgi:pyruvate, water dikinase
MRALELIEPLPQAEFGGKAASLSEAIRAGLPVPPGFALDVEMVEAVHRGETPALLAVQHAFDELGGAIAVRSSAIGEDSADASFAGQHLTVLNVTSAVDAVEAIRRVRDSARAKSALDYRRQRGLPETPRMGVVLQALVAADAAGVMFTRNPVTGHDERVIEGAWGLGEAVVSGLVTPDEYRLDREGRLLEMHLGEKHVAIRALPTGGVHEEPIDVRLEGRPALSSAELGRLHALASLCEEVYGPALDIEWVVAAGQPYLVQTRPITAGRAVTAA